MSIKLPKIEFKFPMGIFHEYVKGIIHYMDFYSVIIDENQRELKNKLIFEIKSCALTDVRIEDYNPVIYNQLLKYDMKDYISMDIYIMNNFTINDEIKKQAYSLLSNFEKFNKDILIGNIFTYLGDNDIIKLRLLNKNISYFIKIYHHKTREKLYEFPKKNKITNKFVSKNDCFINVFKNDIDEHFSLGVFRK
jgi:hypothetical protein